jgi:hypothetical protein
MCSVFTWLEKTSPNKKGNSREERSRLAAFRKERCEQAGTNIHILINAKCRGAIGRDLVERMAAATKKDKIKILVKSHFPENK